MPLWRLSVKTIPAAEEAVTALLEEVFQQPCSVFADARDQTVTAPIYLQKASEASPTRRTALRAGLRRIGLAKVPAKVTRIPREDWAESWKRHFKPIEIGSALLLKPSWSQRRAKKHQAMVVLDPGLSFGTGQHPTTRFCLEQLVRFRKRGTAQSFLDIGTGSGILAISAAKLGYAPVMAIDSDPEAVRVARANARTNRVQRSIKIAQRDLTKMPGRPAHKFHLVCANLIFDLLLAENRRITGFVQPGGVLVLAGILRSQFHEVRACYEGNGWKVLSTKREKEWASAALARKDAR